MYRTMALVTLVTVLLDLIATTCALSLTTGTTTRLKQVPGGKRPLGPIALRNALLKYNRPVPPQVQAAAENPFILEQQYDLHKQNGSAPATPVHDDNLFLVPVTVGKSKLMMDFDTGSADFWTFSVDQPKKQREGHALYNTSTGTLLKGYSWKILYGEGSKAKGIVYRDSVRVGGVTATTQAVEAATSASTQFLRGAADGLVGLSFDRLNRVKPNKQPTLWQNLSPTLKKPVFTADLKYKAPGTYDFGMIDPSKYLGSITYSEMTMKGASGFWNCEFDGYKVDNTSLPVRSYKQYPLSIFIDTGTTVSVTSYETARAYYKNVKGAKYVALQWVFPCDSTLPDLDVVIKGKAFTIPGKYLKQRLGDYICYGGIQPSSHYNTFDLLGDTFLVSQFVVFDLGTPKRLGFARKHLDVK